MSDVAITLPIKTWRVVIDELFHAAYQLYAPPHGWCAEDYARQKTLMFSSMSAIGRQQGKTRLLSVHGYLIVLEEIDRLRRYKNLTTEQRMAAGEFSGAVTAAEEMQTVLHLDRRVKQAEAAMCALEQALRAAETAVAEARKAVYLDGAEEAEEGCVEEGSEAAGAATAPQA